MRATEAEWWWRGRGKYRERGRIGGERGRRARAGFAAAVEPHLSMNSLYFCSMQNKQTFPVEKKWRERKRGKKKKKKREKKKRKRNKERPCVSSSSFVSPRPQRPRIPSGNRVG